MRLEEALAAVSKGISDRIAAGPSATAVDLDAAPPAVESDATDARDGVLLPRTPDERAGDIASPSREVARLEDVLKVSPSAPAAASVPPPAAASEAVEADDEVVAEAATELISIPPPFAAPSYVAAQALREAFWFEQASAFTGTPASTPPPVKPDLTPAPPVVEPQTEPAPRDASAPPQAGSNGWVTAMFLLTLIALVMLLTGRRPRR
jgi:hypothetical protein